ncbi:hypothetical protein MTR_4g063835 [Medicago truncatula]|uniref:Uncharacterized protein n=1 Tax=Medicago truncatula TaxID=3880 RepID=A0A072UM26_MEDTR|nr:hypothetical protein MTR_4g063835 [Medicago truncatula]
MCRVTSKYVKIKIEIGKKNRVSEIRTSTPGPIFIKRAEPPILQGRPYMTSYRRSLNYLLTLLNTWFKLRFNISGSWRPNYPILVMNLSPLLFMEYKGTMSGRCCDPNSVDCGNVRFNQVIYNRHQPS